MSYGAYANPYAQDGRGGNPYGQQGSNGYGQPSGAPYAQQTANPYAQQGPDPYASQGQYGGGGYQETQQMGGQAQDGIELQSVGKDPNAILNSCREVDHGIDAIEDNLNRLKSLQKQSLGDPNTSPTSPVNRELDRLGDETMVLYRNFVARLKTIKTQPDSASPKNAPQVGRVDRRLKSAIQQYQTVERDFRRDLQAQIARNFRMVNPEATDAEVQRVVEDSSSNQIFSQALLQSDRRGQVRHAFQEVNDRHTAIQKIEQQLIQVAQLFQDLEALVVQQEPAVTQIEQKGEQVTQDVSKANQEISGAITKARSRNRKKWWCLLIVLLLIIIIVIIVVVVVLVVKK